MTDNTRIIDLTVLELKELIRSEIQKMEIIQNERKLHYGIKGIADIFGCSTATAQRIKNTGLIDKAISQVGRKLVIDGEKALQLYQLKK